MVDSPVFIDTGYLVALVNRRDRLHEEAKTIAQNLKIKGRRVVTTDGVLIEFANFFAHSPLRVRVLASIRRIRATPGWLVERLTDTWMDRGEARYGAHPDKDWSLTDCLSMEVMVHHGSKEVATPDRHFVQAGFRVLMRSGAR
jgi:predicted nucleic acid-binding protein